MPPVSLNFDEPRKLTWLRQRKTLSATFIMVLLRLIARQNGLARASAMAGWRAGLRHSSTAPATVIDAGFWRSLIPKPLRKENREKRAQGQSKEWNPATYFIAMFVLVGSMSIQMIALRKQTDTYARQSRVRLELLREVVERIRNGEEVDVEKVLGTGDEQKEADWEEVLRAINRDEASRKRTRVEEKPKQPDSRETKDMHSSSGSPEPPAAKSKPASLGSFF
ncbi:hypothetical protein CDD83_8439 [Cordyceps sp. RAO-2017]|nr:hypothetical protein CDD83_8439 [Cordyceps sp. RAO-2017]